MRRNGRNEYDPNEADRTRAQQHAAERNREQERLATLRELIREIVREELELGE